MYMKKMTVVLLVGGILSSKQLLSVTEITQESNQIKEISLPEEIMDSNQQEILASGNTSYGTHCVSGKACLITKRKELKKICKDDIVVTPAIHSTWYPEIGLAAAIIIEKDDDTGMAMALGRALDIPVIIGAHGITKKIIDGQTITCDPITRNIYHVAYPDHVKRFGFDTLTLSEKNLNHDVIRDKLYKQKANDTPQEIPLQSGTEQTETIDHISHPHRRRITKDIYFSHFNRFKKFALSEKSQFCWTKWVGGMKAVEAGARNFGGCDPFAVECISVGESFFDSDETHFVKTLHDIGESDICINFMNYLIEECSKKPGDLNWVARVSHYGHIESIDLPEDADEEDLKKHPKKYSTIQHKVDKSKREALTAASLFVRFFTKEKLSL